MTVYVVAYLTFTNRKAYDGYVVKFASVFARFEGTLLAADEFPEVLEGQWSGEKVVLISFPDAAACQRWSDSPDYLDIARDRKAGAEALVMLVKGLS